MLKRKTVALPGGPPPRRLVEVENRPAVIDAVMIYAQKAPAAAATCTPITPCRARRRQAGGVYESLQRVTDKEFAQWMRLSNAIPLKSSGRYARKPELVLKLLLKALRPATGTNRAWPCGSRAWPAGGTIKVRTK
jgi:hypothetical protein